MKKIICCLIAAGLLSGCADLFPKNKTITHAKLESFKPSLAVEPVWFKKIGNGTESEYLRIRPVVSSGLIYTASHDGSVMVLKSQSTDVVWRTDLAAKISSGVTLGEGYLFVGTPDGDLIALKQDHGNVAWRAKLQGDMIAPPTVSNGRVFAKTVSGNVYAVDVTSGKILWNYSVPTPQMVLRANSAPVVVKNTVIVGFADGEVIALNAIDGKQLWKSQIAVSRGTTIIERMVDVAASPKVDHDSVFVVSYHGQLSALDRKTGKLKWHHKLSSYSGMTLSDKVLYVTDSHSHIWAFNTDTGKVLWRQEQLFGRELTSPTVVGQYLVLGDNEGYVHWLSRQDGHFVARQRADSSRIITAPITDGNRAYVYTASGELVQYKPKSI